MNSPMPRFVKLDDWVFEVKTVKAYRSAGFCISYSGITNLSVIGDSVYVDGMLTRNEDDFTRKDFMTFYRFCEQLGMKSFLYDRIKNGKRQTHTVEITQNLRPMPNIRLVK